MEVHYPNQTNNSYSYESYSPYGSYANRSQSQELFQAENDVNRLTNLVFQLEARIEELEIEVSDLQKELSTKNSEIQAFKALPAQNPQMETATKTDVSTWNEMEKLLSQNI